MITVFKSAFQLISICAVDKNGEGITKRYIIFIYQNIYHTADVKIGTGDNNLDKANQQE